MGQKHLPVRTVRYPYSRDLRNMTQQLSDSALAAFTTAREVKKEQPPLPKVHSTDS